MKHQWLGALAVLLAAAGIIAVKQLAPASGGSPPTGPGSPTPAVVLFADPAEAESACGCGEIIRFVRAAASRGVPVREVPPADTETNRAYRVTVSPTVVFLDPHGTIVSRFEGEGAQTIEAIRASLDKLAGPPR